MKDRGVHPMSTVFPGSFDTTIYFWDCSCDDFYIHPHYEKTCPDCTDNRDENPDSRVDEVIKYAKAWQLDPDVVHQVELAYPKYSSLLSEEQVDAIFSLPNVMCDELTDEQFQQLILSLD